MISEAGTEEKNGRKKEFKFDPELGDEIITKQIHEILKNTKM